jgi:hypothetical protein
VRLYAIDATGLTVAEGFSAADRVVPRARASWTGQADHQHSLEYIADATGGLAVRNTNDPSDGLSRIVADLSFVYSLGYQTPARSADEVRRLHVSLPEHPELEVRCRRWVVHKSADTRFRERVRSALLRPPPDNPLDLRVRAGVPSSTDRGLWEVPIVVSVPIRQLTLAQESDHLVGRVEVLLGLRDDRGRESPLRRVEMDLQLPASAADVTAGDRYSVRVTVRCRERRQQVAVGLRDPASGRASVARTEIAPP